MPRQKGGAGGSAWRRITIPVPPDLSDRIDAAVHGTPGETLTSLIRRAIANEIDRLEEMRGGGKGRVPFPPAPGRPPPGRPRKATGFAEPSRSSVACEPSTEVERLLHVLERKGEAEKSRPPRARAARKGGDDGS